MVQVSTTLFVAALAVAPALAAPLTLAEEFETRDVQELEVRGRITKALGRFFGSAGSSAASSAVEAQVNGARSFDEDLEARTRRQSSGISSSLGRFVGGVGSGIVANQLGTARRSFMDDEELEVRGKKGRKNRHRKNQNKQAETPSTNTEQSSTTENTSRDFIDIDDLLEARAGRGRQSSGVSSSLGRFVGGVGSGIIANQAGTERRSFIEDEDWLEVRGKKSRKNRHRKNQNKQAETPSTNTEQSSTTENGARDFIDIDDLLEVRGGGKGNKGKSNNQPKKQQPARQQPQRQSSGVSSSLGRFVGGVGQAIAEGQANGERSFTDEEVLLALRDFIDFDDLVYEAREIDELD